jgi:peptide/nickel transport system permease protein
VWTLILRRTAAMGFSILFLTALIFFLMQAVFGDPVVVMLGRDSDPDTVARLRRDLGLDRPAYVQYADWLGRLAHGDWGRSFRTGQPVLSAIATRIPTSLELAVLSLLLAVGLAVILGTWAAIRPHTRLDAGISVLTAFGTAMPNFWIAILLILLFALHLRVLPSSGSIPFLDNPLGHLRAMALPTVTLSVAYLCNLTRLVRAKMLESLNTDYVRTARAKGLREARVLWVHALRNSMLPVLSILAVSMSRLFGGAVVTETIFALPGVGVLLVDSILGRDFPVVQGIIILVTVGVFATTFLIEIAYAVVDPRVRYQ